MERPRDKNGAYIPYKPEYWNNVLICRDKNRKVIYSVSVTPPIKK